MTDKSDDDDADRPRAPRPAWRQWAALVAMSLVLAAVLSWARFPAALLVGPMFAGIVAGVGGATIRPPAWSFEAAQAVVGCLIAGAISTSFLAAFAEVWPLILAVMVMTLAASGALGWAMSRWRVLPGTTGVWGSAPGAATAMVLMAGAFGADERLVAFMQYLRVTVVTAVAALIARIWVGTSGAPVPQPDWFAPVDLPAFAATIAVAVAGSALGWLARLPTPNFLGPMVLAVSLKFAGLLTVELPEILLALSYAAVGWTIGLRFTRQTMRTVRESFLKVLASIFVLIVFCAALAWVLVVYTGVDPLTAYLATSPGGMDAIAIIAAASSTVDMSFVMMAQMMRFLIVLLLGPPLAKLVARHVAARL